jgi:hypothetical protein
VNTQRICIIQRAPNYKFFSLRNPSTKLQMNYCALHTL